MKQGVLAALIVGFVVVGAGIGFILGGVGLGIGSPSDQRIKTLEAKVNDLTAQLTAMKGSNTAPGSYKIAYVDMFKVLETLYTMENEVVKQALADFETEKAKVEAQEAVLDTDFANGKISKTDHDTKTNDLEMGLQQKNLELSAPIQGEILSAVKKIGDANGYAIVIDNPASKLSPVVLDSRKGQADDITQLVIDALKETLKQESQPQTPPPSK
ncbi:OmpH family outer membrane protein [Candidatus Acetothermia bacterium]|nr:OmpH family outer membrane protein [Candidatus Acetothermia bacterium]MBI3642518.1 OmpH family outer membrane protein [Candidatus Acetothermia bacterium]